MALPNPPTMLIHLDRDVKLLIVEDDFFMCDLYKREAAKAGYKIETAANGTEAIDRAQSFLPDILLLDLMLPQADGIQVMQTLRKLSQFEKTPIVIITNVDEPEVVKKAKEAGATEYLLKVASTPDQVINSLSKYFPSR